MLRVEDAYDLTASPSGHLHEVYRQENFAPDFARASLSLNRSTGSAAMAAPLCKGQQTLESWMDFARPDGQVGDFGDQRIIARHREDTWKTSRKRFDTPSLWTTLLQK